VPIGRGRSVAVIRLTRHAVAIAVHMFAIAGAAASERGFAGGADFVAAFIIYGLLHRIARRDFFLGQPEKL
jgi:hypothetical protein